MAQCTHLDHIKITERPGSVDGCEECLAEGTKWLHLRMCLECGHVGCCDDSPGQHTTKHAESADHPLITSLEPGEDWSFCFPDNVAMRIAEIKGESQIPPSPLARELGLQ